MSDNGIRDSSMVRRREFLGLAASAFAAPAFSRDVHSPSRIETLDLTAPGARVIPGRVYGSLPAMTTTPVFTARFTCSTDNMRLSATAKA
jgi:hypothetical protein